jgi:hypothetical protein
MLRSAGVANPANERFDVLHPITRDDEDGILGFDDDVTLEPNCGDETALRDHEAIGCVVGKHITP